MTFEKAKEEIKKELELYKYPYDARAKLLNSIIYLLEVYEETTDDLLY